jgi:uncharacterized protein (DUF433 family)
MGEPCKKLTSLLLSIGQRNVLTPVVRGARVPVEIVLRELGAGMIPEAVIGDHPRLTLDDVRAAQTFAADLLADEALVHG